MTTTTTTPPSDGWRLGGRGGKQRLIPDPTTGELRAYQRTSTFAIRYAAGTTVSVQRSLTELQTLAGRFGAKKFGFATDGERSVVTFEAGRMYRLEVEPAQPAQFASTPSGRKRDKATMERLAAEETARRWRSLVLLVKALLVAVNDGLMDAPTALLPWTVLPDGSTLGQWAGPQLDSLHSSGMAALTAGTAAGAR